MVATGNFCKCRLLFVLLVVKSFAICSVVLPIYTPALQNDNLERVYLIERYVFLGLGYREILLFLGSLHGCFFEPSPTEGDIKTAWTL